MSGFAVVYERSTVPVDAGVLDRVMRRLDHRGPDGSHTWSSGPVAMGHQHFWVTPEEVGEQQPLSLPDLPYRMVMDGRLDNRADLIRGLGIEPGEPARATDAALILQAYARWGTACFEKLIGEFALVIYDPADHSLVCARDPLGDRTLFYLTDGTRVVIASEAWAVTAGTDRPVVLSERALAYYFAIKIPPEGQTLIAGVHELPPAHWMKISPAGETRCCYWQYSPSPRPARRSDDEYTEEFRSLLSESVRCRLRSITPPGVMMSGGHDSTSIACLAAQMLAPAQLTTVSYVFDHFSDCDERVFINAVRDQYNTRSIQVLCDDLWPFQGRMRYPSDPSWPSTEPYFPILDRAYTHARAAGLRILLLGHFADILYTGSENFLADTLAHRNFRRLWQEMHYLAGNFKLKQIVRSRAMRQLVKQALPGILLPRRKPAAPRAPEWLTPFAAGLLDNETPTAVLPRQSAILNSRNAAANSIHQSISSLYGQELRFPYRDRRLVEFYLSLPAYLLYSRGSFKYIVRQAMQGISPEIVRTRSGNTGLYQLYNQGIVHEKTNIEQQLSLPGVAWQQFVRTDFICSWMNKEVTHANDGARAVVLPLCLLFVQWYKSINDDNTSRRLV